MTLRMVVAGVPAHMGICRPSLRHALPRPDAHRPRLSAVAAASRRECAPSLLRIADTIGRPCAPEPPAARRSRRCGDRRSARARRAGAGSDQPGCCAWSPAHRADPLYAERAQPLPARAPPVHSELVEHLQRLQRRFRHPRSPAPGHARMDRGTAPTRAASRRAGPRRTRPSRCRRSTVTPRPGQVPVQLADDVPEPGGIAPWAANLAWMPSATSCRPLSQAHSAYPIPEYRIRSATAASRPAPRRRRAASGGLQVTAPGEQPGEHGDAVDVEHARVVDRVEQPPQPAVRVVPVTNPQTELGAVHLEVVRVRPEAALPG